MQGMERYLVRAVRRTPRVQCAEKSYAQRADGERRVPPTVGGWGGGRGGAVLGTA
jgi:hypothetical protein